jgi:5'-AMP-activated protein kinase, regulatory gamma subunit
VCTRQDQLRLVLERLSMPAVRRVIVVHPESARVEGIISLSDAARAIFM